MSIHCLTAEAALAELRTAPEGLAEAEAQRRLSEYGPNRVAAARRRNPVLVLAQEFTQLFPLVMWVAAALAFLLEREAPGEGMARLGGALIVVIVVSGLFSYWQEFRAAKTLAALMRLLPSQVRVMRGGLAREVLAETLVPGDILLLGDGDNVPADCRVLEAYGARVNTSTLTGEATAQPCTAAVSKEDSLTEARNILFAGTTLVAGQVRAMVFATGMRTAFGAISRLAEESGDAPSPLRLQIAHLSRFIVVLSVALGVSFFATGWLIGIPLWQGFIFAIGIIVAMVPEGLLPTLTLSLVLASQRMARRKVLIRHLPAVEALGSVTVICTDKTGTLTENRMTVSAVFPGVGPEMVASDIRAAAAEPMHRELFLAAALCNDVAEGERGGVRTLLGDPMEIALIDLARKALPGNIGARRLHEIPFDTERMRLSTIYESANGPVLYCKGAPESVLPICTRVVIDGCVQPLSPDQRSAIERAHADMTNRGLRVLAFAWRDATEYSNDAELERGLVYCGLAGLEDPPRSEVRDAVRRCRDAGIRVIMITGDHPGTALAIARKIGLVTSAHPLVVTGEDLRRHSELQLQIALDAPEILFARVGPDQKHRIVEALKRKGEIVAVTGDGVNDAPALKSAHIGVSMGIAGTDVARAAADIVLLDDNFASIVEGVEQGRVVFDNIRKLLTYPLAHNVPELVPYLAYALLRIPPALTPMQILAIDMGTDSITALGLGIENPEPGVMQRPPRAPDERLLDWRVALRAYLFLGLIESVAVMSIFVFLLSDGGWRFGDSVSYVAPLYLQATTACLIAVVVMQSANVFLCRSPTRSLLATGLGGNALIVWGVVFGIGLALAIVATPLGNAFFGTAPIGVDAWLIAVPFAAALVVLEELRKAVVRRTCAANASRPDIEYRDRSPIT
jgi:calcium-translocating P-type ATPase